jgi:hypothetical protein
MAVCCDRNLKLRAQTMMQIYSFLIQSYAVLLLYRS